VAVVVTPRDGGSVDPTQLIALCRQRLPAYMVPAQVVVRAGPLPRNANGKIDRKLLATEQREAARGLA
jgi:acyl-CoA synthetase (AMP-forming)/AMP-acid ligase II